MDNPHALLEALATDVITLTEDLDAGALSRSRLTRVETILRLRSMAALATELPVGAREALPEIDWTRWRALGQRLSDAEIDPALLWSAARELCTETLQWLRVYGEAAPDWYCRGAGEGDCAGLS